MVHRDTPTIPRLLLFAARTALEASAFVGEFPAHALHRIVNANENERKRWTHSGEGAMYRFILQWTLQMVPPELITPRVLDIIRDEITQDSVYAQITNTICPAGLPGIPPAVLFKLVLGVLHEGGTLSKPWFWNVFSRVEDAIIRESQLLRARAKADAPLPETPTAKDPLGTALALHAEDIQELSDAADVPTFSKGQLRYLFATKHLMADIHVLHMAHSDPSNSSREGSLSSSASTTVVGGLIEVKPEPQESDVCMPDAPEPNTDPCVQEISPVQDVVLTRPKTGDLPVLTTAAIPSIHVQVKPEPTSDLRIPVLVTEPSIPRPKQQLFTAPPVYDTDLQSLIDGMDGPLFKPGTLLRTHPPLIPEPQSLQTQDDTPVTCPPRLVHPGLPPKPGPPVALHPMYREPSAAPSGPQNGKGPRQNPPIHRKPPAAPHPQGRGYDRNPNPLPPQETLKKVLLTRPAVSRQSLLERIAPRSDQENLAPLPVPVFAPEPTVPVDTRKHPPTGARAESNVRYEPYPTKHDGPYSEIYDELHPDERYEPYSETQRPDEQHLDRRDPAQPTRRDEPRLDRRHNLYPERRCGPYRDPREEMRDEPRAEGQRGPHFGRRGDMYPDRRYEPHPSRNATGQVRRERVYSA